MKNYPPDFKADAVALYESRPEATIRSVASDNDHRSPSRTPSNTHQLRWHQPHNPCSGFGVKAQALEAQINTLLEKHPLPRVLISMPEIAARTVAVVLVTSGDGTSCEHRTPRLA